MRMGYPQAGWLLAAALILAVAGCQSDKAADVLDPAAVAPAEQNASLSSTASIGTGAAKVAVLLPFSANGADAADARDIHDGVALAMDDLGKDRLTINFVDTPADSEKARTVALKAMAAGAAAVIGPFRAGAAAGVAAIRGGQHAPIFLMNDAAKGGSGVYTVPLDATTSIATAVDALARKESRNFVLILPEGKSAPAVERAVDFAAANHGGRLAAKARYSGQASVQAAVDTVFAVMAEPDAVVIDGGSLSGAVVDAVRAKRRTVPIIIANNYRDAANPSLEGALVADIDRREMGSVSGRYQARFGRPMAPRAAYAYDVVALLAGVEGAIGVKGIVPPIIESGQGYRGTTGLFRFRPDGRVERLLPLYRLKKGQLVEIAAAAKKF